MMSLATRTTRSLRPIIRQAVPARCMTILSKQSGEEYKKENYDARMKKTGRPVSPHVAIYAFPAAALTSIVVRATGMTLSLGTLGLGVVEMAGGPGSALSLMETIGSSGLAYPAKFCVAFPLTYHYLGGLRHYIWDNKPELLTNAGVEKASYYLAGGSLLLSSIMVVM